MQILFAAAALFVWLPFVSSWMALLLGMLLALVMGNPFESLTKKWTTPLLQVSVVGLGAGMNLETVARAGAHGFLYTLLGIVLIVAVGLLFGRLLKVEGETSLLVTVGTAICGGSAIAAVASTIRARNQNMSLALATVFFLNAVALILFPPLGRYFGLTQEQFGLWSALAIHDTSSVVGASLQYGAEAMQVAVPVKLARALWIVPLTLVVGAFWKHADGAGSAKAKRPWFILGFLLVAALVSWAPALQEAGSLVAAFAKRSLVFTLFLIGSGLTRSTIRAVGFRPLLQGVLLWVLVTGVSLMAIR